jgi:hypothetical protein
MFPIFGRKYWKYNQVDIRLMKSIIQKLK